jgi:hypothetical protein
VKRRRKADALACSGIGRAPAPGYPLRDISLVRYPRVYSRRVAPEDESDAGQRQPVLVPFEKREFLELWVDRENDCCASKHGSQGVDSSPFTAIPETLILTAQERARQDANRVSECSRKPHGASLASVCRLTMAQQRS